jgi:hypothetical protein
MRSRHLYLVTTASSLALQALSPHWQGPDLPTRKGTHTAIGHLLFAALGDMVVRSKSRWHAESDSLRLV